MAINFMKISKGINFKGNSAPSSPENGDMYYDSGSNTFQFYQNGAWITYLPTSGGTMSGAINMGSNKITSAADPTSPQDLGTKNYIDTSISNAIAGVNPAVAVQAATTAASDTSSLTYNNGASGIGATLTGAINTAITIDGFTFTAVGQRLLVKNDTQSPSGAFNGVYFFSQLQTGLLAPVFTRALDYDQPSDINNTGAIPVINGTANGTTQWVLTSQVTTVGTDPLTFAKFARNPADYLLKTNNLSDVSSPSTAFANIAPTPGTSGNVLTSNGSSWVSQTPSGGGGISAWATSTPYTAGMLVTYENYIYTCLTSNTSGSTFAADVALGYWLPTNQPVLNSNKVLVGNNFEDNTVGGWQKFNVSGYSAGTTPTTAPTLGTAASITTFQTTSSSPLSGKYSLQLASTSGSAIAAGQGIISQAYSIDTADQVKIFNTLFAYSAYTGSSNMNFSGSSSNSWGIFIYDVTNSAWIAPTNVYGISQASGVGNAFTQWQTPSNMTQFKIALLCINSTGTSGVTGLMIDNVSTGQQQFPGYGVITTDWASYSLTISATSSNPTQGSGANSSAMWKRNGDSVEIYFVYSQTSAGSAGSGTYLFSLPSGLTIDTSKVVTTNNGNGIDGTVLGSAYTGTTTSSGGSSSEIGQVIAWNSTQLAIITSYSGSNPQIYGMIGSGSNSLSDNPQYYSFTAKIPILGWSSQAQIVSQYDGRVVAAQVTSSNTNVTAGATSVIVFPVVNYDTHAAYSTSTGLYTCPVAGMYNVSLAGLLSGGINLVLNKNGSYYLGMVQAAGGISSASVDVQCNAGDTLSLYNTSGSSTLNYSAGIYQPSMSISLKSGAQQILASDPLPKYSGYYPWSASNYWLNSTSSGGVYTDYTVFGTTPTPTTYYNSGFGTVSKTSGNLPGMTFTATKSGTIEVTFIISVRANSSNSSFRLFESSTSTEIDAKYLIPATAPYPQIVLEGFFDVVAGTTYTFVTQYVGDGGSGAYIGNVNTAVNTVPIMTMKAQYMNVSINNNAISSPSYLRLDGNTSFGITNTKIAIMTSMTNKGGSALTYATSSTLGDSITVNRAGVYTVSFTGALSSGPASFGASVNSSQLTTNIYSVTATNVLIQDTCEGTGHSFGGSFTGYFNVGDVIRPHGDGTVAYSGNNAAMVFSVSGPF